ncbi:MAG: adenylyl-sulfate kinase [Candidatus Omnitrophota bacterium]
MRRSLVFWFTGLSGSGKTTIANAAKALLEKDGYSVLIIDGDDVRKRLHADLGFSEADIKKNNELIAGLCKKQRGDYDAVFVPIISPYAASRENARATLEKGFYEIYFSAGLETVMARDVKGLYSKAKRNEIKNLIGYSPGNAYEPPVKPDFTVDSTSARAEDSARVFYDFVKGEIERHGNG